MKEIRTLSELDPGERAVVRRLDAGGETRRRLQDIGLIRGTAVVCLRKSPLGDPVAYRIRGATMALRGVDARRVEVSQ